MVNHGGPDGPEHGVSPICFGLEPCERDELYSPTSQQRYRQFRVLRVQRLSAKLSERHIPAGVSHLGVLPVLDMEACPYPLLMDESDDRAMCRLEEQMISEALGQEVQLSSCRLDGDSCCQFSTVSQQASEER